MNNVSAVTTAIVGMWMTAAEKGYSSYCYWIGPVPTVVTQDPEHIKVSFNIPSFEI